AGNRRKSVARHPCGQARLSCAVEGSTLFSLGEQLAQRAQESRLGAPRRRCALGLDPCPQAKTRRLRRMAALAVLPAAHPSPPLLHQSNIAPPCTAGRVTEL